MKKNLKSAAILCLVATLLCALLLFAACDDGRDDGGGETPPAEDGAVTYEVKVLLADETPAKGTKATFVETAEGETFLPYTMSVDDEGVARYTSEAGNPVNVTLSGVPSGYAIPEGSETLRLRKASPKIVVTLKRADVPDDSPDLEYSLPLSGSGTARYVSGNAGQIEYNSFKPYVVVEGNYKFKFESEEQRIYLQFNSGSSEAGLYRIYSRGSADVSVQMLSGSTIGGLFNPGETAKDNDLRPLFNDDKSKTNKNFELEFSNNESVTMGYSIEGVFYFELALKAETDLGKSFAVTFEKLDEPYVPKPPTQYRDVVATPSPEQAPEGDGELHTIPLNCANFVVVKAADGTYHLGSESGATLYANLDGAWPCGATLQGGEPMTCILRTSGGTNPYRWTDDGVTGENWLPFIAEYAGYIVDSDGTLIPPGITNGNTGRKNDGSSKCNSDGYYPVNDQIVKFLMRLYDDIEIQNFYFTPDNYMGTTWFLPEGYEWIFLCGYYGEEYKGSDFEGSGTEEDPFVVLRAGEYDIEIPAGERVYFTARHEFSFYMDTPGFNVEYDMWTEHVGENQAIEMPLIPSYAKLLSIWYDEDVDITLHVSIFEAVSGEGSLEEPFIPNSVTGEYSERVTAGEKVWYNFGMYIVDGGGKFIFEAAVAGITFEVYDSDGWAALVDGDEAEPLYVFTSTEDVMSFEFELDKYECFFAVSFELSATIEWNIEKAE